MVVWASRCKKTGVTLENLIFMAHLLDLTSTAEIPRCLDFYGSRHQLKMTPTNHGAMVKVSFPSDSVHKSVIRCLLVVVGLIRISVFFLRSPKKNSEGLMHQFRSFDLCFFGGGEFWKVNNGYGSLGGWFEMFYNCHPNALEKWSKFDDLRSFFSKPAWKPAKIVSWIIPWIRPFCSSRRQGGILLLSNVYPPWN